MLFIDGTRVITRTMSVRKQLGPLFDAVCDDNCCICLCRFSDDNIGTELRCKHVFHAGCIEKCEVYKMFNCPLCREPIYTKIVIRIHELYGLLAFCFTHEIIEEYVFTYLDYNESYSNYDIYDALHLLYIENSNNIGYILA